MLSQAEAELRHAIWNIREGGQKDERLGKLIEAALAEIEVPPPIRVTLATSDRSPVMAPSRAREATLVVREAVLNAVQHAGPRSVEVGILSEEQGLHLWVRDDGCGFSPDAPPSRAAAW